AHVPADVSEPEVAGLEMLPSRLVKPPRVALAPAHLECVYLETHRVKTRDRTDHSYELVFGEVVAIHVDDRFLVEGRLDTAAMRPVARMGYDEYTVVTEAFRMDRPDSDVMAFLAGGSGS